MRYVTALDTVSSLSCCAASKKTCGQG